MDSKNRRRTIRTLNALAQELADARSTPEPPPAAGREAARELRFLRLLTRALLEVVIDGGLCSRDDVVARVRALHQLGNPDEDLEAELLGG